MLRIILGFFLLYGAVGSLDHDPTFPVIGALAIAALGLILMFFGVNSIKERV